MEILNEQQLTNFVGKTCFIKCKDGAVFKNSKILSIDNPESPVQFVNFIKPDKKGSAVDIAEVSRIDEE